MSRGWNFYSNERTQRFSEDINKTSSALCSNFVNIISIRQPMQHALSHINEVMQAVGSSIRRTMGSDSVDLMLNETSQLNSTFAFLNHTIPAIIDNYFIRFILGPGHLCHHFGQLTEADLQQAMAHLMDFDVILSTDEVPLSDILMK